jgi:hypothetical protein
VDLPNVGFTCEKKIKKRDIQFYEYRECEKTFVSEEELVLHDWKNHCDQLYKKKMEIAKPKDAIHDPIGVFHDQVNAKWIVIGGPFRDC